MAESNVLKNRNFLSQLNWKFNLHRSPSLNFWIQEINIPDMLLTPAEVASPLIKYPVAPDHMIFGDLKVVFKIDEDLQNFFELYSWMKALGSPENFEGFAKLDSSNTISDKGIYSDITVAIQNAEHEVRFLVEYKDALPTFLGNIKFVTTDQDVKYVTAGAVFKYTTYDIYPYGAS